MNSHVLPRSYANATAFMNAVDILLTEIISMIKKAAKLQNAGKRDVALLDASLTLGCLTSYLAGKWKDLVSVIFMLIMIGATCIEIPSQMCHVSARPRAQTSDVAAILTGHKKQELELPAVWEKLARQLAREPRVYDGDFDGAQVAYL